MTVPIWPQITAAAASLRTIGGAYVYVAAALEHDHQILREESTMTEARDKALCRRDPGGQLMADTCRPVEIDGETILVHGSEAMTDEDRGYFAEIVRAAKAKVSADRLAEAIRADLAAQSDHYTKHPRQDDAGEGES